VVDEIRTCVAHRPKPQTEHVRVRNRYMCDAHCPQALDVSTSHSLLISNFARHWMIDWMVDRMIDWMIDWMNDWMFDWMIDWID
jgi:hypothetical protein